MQTVTDGIQTNIKEKVSKNSRNPKQTISPKNKPSDQEIIPKFCRKSDSLAQQRQKLIKKYFEKNIKSKKAPKKNECVESISRYPGIVKPCDWLRVTTLVFNTYRKEDM